MVLERLKSNIKAQTLSRESRLQHSRSEWQPVNVCGQSDGRYHWEGPWAYMDCPAIDTMESSGSRPAASSCSMSLTTWGDPGVTRIVLLEELWMFGTMLPGMPGRQLW